MANVNLKTDFRNGETLFDYQLNNNFKALEEALKAANAIIWQDNADKVVTFRGNTEELKAREIINGQILYNTDTGESYIDYKGKRISTGSGNAIHIGENEPTNASTQLWIDRDELAGVGSEVINSLEGNQERMAPSVDAVKKGINEAVTEYYSTEETFTGKYWIDGKKVYRKSFIITPVTESYVNTDVSSLDIDLITAFDGYAESMFDNAWTIPHITSDGYTNNWYYVRSSKIIRIDFGAYYEDKNRAIFTIEYTKTTDTVEESEE